MCVNALDAQLESFTTSLRSWLLNKPREIIIMVANREQVEQITAAVEEEDGWVFCLRVGFVVGRHVDAVGESRADRV